MNATHTFSKVIKNEDKKCTLLITLSTTQASGAKLG